MEHEDSQTDLPDYDEPENNFQMIRRYENFPPEVRRLRTIKGFGIYHGHSHLMLSKIWYHTDIFYDIIKQTFSKRHMIRIGTLQTTILILIDDFKYNIYIIHFRKQSF